jgi:AcrR family transcriptional regulator
MPAPAKVTDDEVVAAARRLIERHGVGALSMQAVADEVGVRAPSLYKRFADRGALLAAVQRGVFTDVERRLEGAAALHTSAKLALGSMATSYRAFARAHPHLYELMFSRDVPHDAAGDEARRIAARPIVARLTDWVGAERALPAARVVTAFVHGFVSMELQGAFRLGGNVDEAFRLGLELLVPPLGR